MKKVVFALFALLGTAVWGQTGVESALTNAPTDFSKSILVPKVAMPTVIVPTPTTVEVLSGTNPPAPPPPKSGPVPSLFGIKNRPLPPSATDIATRRLKVVAAPLPEPAVASTNAPLEPTVEATPSGGKFRSVSPTGDDAGPGTSDKPWRTIQHAAEVAQPGDIVSVQPGTYPAFHTVHGGTAPRPITFRAVGDVIIVPQDGEAPAGLEPTSMANLYRLDNIHVRETDYVIIEGFQVQRAGRCGISVIEARGVVVRNNVVGPVGRFGIFTGFAPEVQIISNKTFGAATEHGIYVSNSRKPNDNPVIRYNDSYDNRGNGIQVNGDCGSGGDGSITGALVEGNLVHDNGLKGLSLISMSDSVVQNNLIYNNAKYAGAGGIHLTDEIGCGHPSSGNVVVNNTVVEPRMACIRITDGAKDNIIFNNLLVGDRPLADEVGDNQIDQESNVRLDSPLGIFSNSEGGDFHPLVNSPARNAGLASFKDKPAPLFDRDGRRRRVALGYDAGAY